MHNFLVLGFTAILVYGSSIDHTKQLTLKKSHHEQRKMNYKVVPHRCSIVCPLKLELPSCLGALPLQNTSQSSNKTFPMQQDATTIPVLPNLANLTQYLPHIDPNQLYEQVSNGLSQLFQMFQPSNLQIPSGKSHHAFSKKTQTHENRKRQFLKHTRVLYRNGKRVYEFKELQPFGCYATCEEIKNPGGSQGSQMSGDEDSSEDAYEEGEDAPIEATASPGERPAMKLDGLRPVGPVDFMNMADFGPNGSPAMGDEYYSEKNKVHRKKNRRH